LESGASFSTKADRWDFNVHGAYFDSDGYRDNGYFRKDDLIGRFGYALGDHVTLGACASYHGDANGLPGGVSKEDEDSKESRKETARPDDSGDTIDRRYGGSINMDLETLGDVEMRGGYRLRDNSYIMGYTPLLTKEEQTDTIDEETENLSLVYNKSFEISNLDHKIRFGVDHYHTEYVRQELSKDQRKNTDIDNVGIFSAGDLSLTRDLSLQAGYRYNDYDSDFREDERQVFGTVKRWVNGTLSDKNWTNHAEDIGLVYSCNPALSFFTSYATSFRIPNVDELSQAQGDLKPQEGTHIDLGGRYSFKGLLEAAVTAFEIKTEDEIFFDGNLEVNRNYDDKTVRRGIETDVRLCVTDSFYLWGNYTYTHAKFENRDTWIPLVPEHMAKGGMQWRIFEPFEVSFTGIYVGPRFDGNDENNNRFDKLDGYMTLDAKAIYRWKGFKIFAGVNNMLNKLYSTVSYSEIYYPMPERNFYGGVEWNF
jgi:outer membrane receptor protein involved in Fe transport